MISSMRNLITVFLCIAVGVLTATISNSLLYQAPDECRWFGSANDITLVCRLRTINSELENTNFSVIQPQNTIRLRLECNDALLFQSSINPGSFRPLFELRSLTINYCKIGNLTDGSFQGLRELRNLTIQTHNTDWSPMSLEISGNVFTDELKLLERLDLSDNSMRFIPDAMLCPLTSLEYLNLTNNRLHDMISFHFSASPSTRPSKKCGANLQTLDLSHNNIDNLQAAIFSGLGKLQTLQLNNNKMNFIADRALEGLLSLLLINLSENALTNLPPELFNEARNIKEIYLQNNSLNVLAPGLFAELNQLAILDLSHNELTSYWINSGTFKKLKMLVYLDLSFNHIDKLEAAIFSELHDLEILKLNNNQIKYIPEQTFANQSKLTTLVLSNNQLLSVDLKTLANLERLTLLSLDYNRISKIHRLAFVNCTSLQDLHLNGNKLDNVPEALREVTLLKTLDLGENRLTTIKNTPIGEMTHLFGLRLTENYLEQIERETFAKLYALQILNLSRNKIKKVDSGSFSNNSNLQAIRLDGNQLTDIAGLFTDLPNLVWLNISDNHFEIFDYALIPTGLKWLDIHANRIAELGNYFEIQSHLSLSTFDASSNRLTEITGSSIPNSIEVVYLNDNLITRVQSYTFFKKPNITRVDLFGNKISTLDPNALRISHIPEDKPLPEFYVGGNPFQCDCNLDWLQKNNTASRTQPLLMDVASIYCKLLYNRGKTYVPLVEAMANQFLCKYETHCSALCHCCDFVACDCKMGCPNNCTCYHDQSWTSNVVDCSKAEYNDRLPEQIPMDATQIYIDGNNFPEIGSHAFIGRKKLRILFLNSSNIQTLQNRTFNGLFELELLHLGNNKLQVLNGNEFEGLESLTELYLQFNEISYVDNETFSDLVALKMLRLDNNRIQTMNLWMLPTVSLIDLRLSENPWNCFCNDSEYFYEFFRQHQVTKDWQSIKCSLSGESVKSLDEIFVLLSSTERTNLCRMSTKFDSEIIVGSSGGNSTASKTMLLLTHPMEDYVKILIFTFIAILLTITVSLLIFAFRQQLRVWFHSKFGIRLFYHNNDIDKNEREKLFDAFISYSSKDEAFVAEELAPILENGDTRYNLCLHYRDFPVGAYIADTILQAIESSRRTIMVLSENYIKSEWCRFEFKSAHHQVLRDRRRRLIVIILGEIPHKDLDPDIRLYLKTNTYLQWGDKFFWDKLRFALPDVPNNRRNQLNQLNQTASTSRPNLCHHNINIHNNQRNLIQMTNLQPPNNSMPLAAASRVLPVQNL
ncbi:toll-like receptor Tollo [Bradysia coprophila]|uniref:toll-like receptor Tollo n=1 Tax=Bradysia coprophila TaxID=38358 RepID=UPI00187DB4E4|nr:toll-like receptor Tollo [Bradysia coprophila]